MENIKKGFVFMINTDQYAGNFEREMTAHCTGIVGIDDNTGDDFIPENIPIDFKPVVQQCPDDNGTFRPTECCGYEGESVGIYFYDRPSDAHIAYMKKQAVSFAETKRNSGSEWDKDFQLEIKGFSLVEVKPTLITTEL